MASGMATRIRQIKGRQGWYVYLDVPRWVRQRKGGSASIRFKGGATEAEAKRNCLSIEAKQLNKWEAMRDPLGNASLVANQTGERIDIVVDDLLRKAGWSHEISNRVSAAMALDAYELNRQQIKPLDAQIDILSNVIKKVQKQLDTYSQQITDISYKMAPLQEELVKFF